MRAILGIGNKGSRYTNTRHNIGFLLLDNLAQKHSLSFKASTDSYYFCSGQINSSEFILVKPYTYVNNSGISASEFFDTHNLSISDLLVVHDDINLSFGSIRIKAFGGDGGHNGISSIIYHLNSDQFPRLRFGIGNNFEKGAMAEYVLSHLTNLELEVLNKNKDQINLLLEEFIKGGLTGMLNIYSQLYNSSSKENQINLPKDK